MSINRPFTRQQRTTVIRGCSRLSGVLVILQLWLLTATMNAYLGGDASRSVRPRAQARCVVAERRLLRHAHIDRARQ
jgi:hypothetical protein